MRTIYKCSKFEKLQLLQPPPWYKDTNTTPPTIPTEITPMRIIEENFPYEPMGNLLTTDRIDIILINKFKQNSTIPLAEEKIKSLPNDIQGARSHLKDAVADYVSGVLGVLDDACHEQTPTISVTEEKTRLIEVIDQLRWRQGVNNLKKECMLKIQQKRLMSVKIRETLQRLKDGEEEILVGEFPKKHAE